MTYLDHKITAIIQARMESSRFPGKVLKEIDGIPMLGWVIQRASLAETVDQVLVATTDSPSDDPVDDFCAHHQIGCYRGSQHDVLDRYYQAAQINRPDWVVRLTADCPLLDPDVLDRTVKAAWLGGEQAQFDFTANRLPPPWGRTFPIGLDVEVISLPALEQAWHQATEKHQREHVTPYFYESAPPDGYSMIEGWGRSWKLPERDFNILLVDHPEDYGHIRWTVDTQEDLDLVCELVNRLPDDRDCTWLDTLQIYQADDGLAEINSMIVHKTYKDIDERS